MTENLDRKVWDEPALEVLGDLATLTASGGAPIFDGGMTSSNPPVSGP